MPTTDAQLLDQFLQSIIDDITTRHDAARQRASGRTIRSLRKVVRGTTGLLYAAQFFRRLETGRGPTKSSTKGDKPLWELILEWMGERGIRATPYTRKDGSTQDQAKADKSLAWLIARKIHNEGDKLHRSGGSSGVISGAITQERIAAFVGAFGTNKRIEVANALLK
jgi:hypothetical protein